MRRSVRSGRRRSPPEVDDPVFFRDHADALEASTLRVFALNNANLTGPEMAERYVMNLNRIIQRATKPGPYVYVVTAARLEMRWPTAGSGACERCTI